MVFTDFYMIIIEIRFFFFIIHSFRYFIESFNNVIPLVLIP